LPRRIDPSAVTGGLHAVDALLRDTPRRVRRLVLQRGAQDRRLFNLQKRAEAAGIQVQQLPKTQLDQWFPGPHQGVLAFCESRELEDWATVRDRLVARAKDIAAVDEGRATLIVVPAAFE